MQVRRLNLKFLHIVTSEKMLRLCDINTNWSQQKLNIFILSLTVDEYILMAKEKHGYNMEQVC